LKSAEKNAEKSLEKGQSGGSPDKSVSIEKEIDVIGFSQR
jgi:hypothetical protein